MTAKLATIAAFSLAAWAVLAGIIAGIYWLVQSTSHLAWAELMCLAVGAAIFTLWVMSLTSPSDAGPPDTRRPR